MAICPLCHKFVDPLARSTWRRVTGWEHKAAATTRRGGSDIALREPLDEFAHAACITLARAGVAANQLELT